MDFGALQKINTFDDGNQIYKYMPNIWIITGSKFNGQHAGTFGDAGVISFFPAKVLGSLGDAGGIITNDNVLYEKFFQLHDHGRDTQGNLKSWGKNTAPSPGSKAAPIEGME